jgi:hypothetical protein
MSMNIMNIWKVICFVDHLPCNSLTSMLLERGRWTTWKCWLHYKPETHKPLNGSSSRPRKCDWEGTSTCKKKTGWARSPHTSQSRNQCARFSQRDRKVELHLGSGIVDALTCHGFAADSDGHTHEAFQVVVGLLDSNIPRQQFQSFNLFLMLMNLQL